MFSASDFILPHLRLFVSVDIQGSTAFKYSSGEMAAWVPTFIRFFSHFPVSVQGQWQRTTQLLNNSVESGPPPAVWKAAGDEILFVKDITHPSQCLTSLIALKSALDLGNRSLEESSSGALRLKGAAWLAGFPNLNMEVSIEGYESPSRANTSDAIAEKSAMAIAHNRSQPHLRDFIGPSMDIGFRLAGLATSRRFLMSVELAHIVCDESISDSGARGLLSFQYEEGSPLKGVLRSRPYPHMWIDMWHGRPVQTPLERLLQRHACNVTDLHHVCRDFINEAAGFVSPYICLDGKVIYGEIPKDHSTHLRKLRDRVKKDLQDEELRLKTEGVVSTDKDGALSRLILEMFERSQRRVTGKSEHSPGSRKLGKRGSAPIPRTDRTGKSKNRQRTRSKPR